MFASRYTIVSLTSNNNCTGQLDLMVPLRDYMQATKSTRGQPGKASKSPGVGAQPALNSNWDNIVNFLDLLMDTLRENYVSLIIILL